MQLKGLIAAGLLTVGLSTQAMAQNLAIELNKMEANDTGCLAYLVLNNSGGGAIDSLVLDFYTFDANGIIGENLAVQLAPVAAGKLSVKGVQFGSACDAVAQILLNSVPECSSGGAAIEGCASGLTLTSKATTEFVQ